MLIRRTIWLLVFAFAWPLPGAVADDEDQAVPVFEQGEVIVTGQRTAAENIGSIQEIDRDAIRRMGARNVAEALRLASGMRIDTAPTSLSANGKGEFLAGLRGFDPHNVIVLIDGVPVYEPYFRVLDLRQIPVADVAKIKIIKGPTSVLYGPNALGGVINIITQQGAGPPRAHIEGSYGSVERFDGLGSVSGSHKGFTYLFSPAFEKSDGFPVSADFEPTRNEDGGLRDNSDYFDYALSGRLGYGRGAHELSLSVNQYEFSGGVPFSMEAIEPATLWRKGWRKTAVALHGQTAPADFFLARGRAFYTRFYNTITTYEDASMSAVADRGDAVSTYDNHVAGVVLMPTFFLGRSVTLGLSSIAKIDTVSIQDKRGADWVDFGAETYSGGAEVQAQFARVSLMAGTAYNFYRRTRTPDEELGRDNGAVDIQGGAAYSPLDMLQIRAAIARKSSFPDLKTLYGSNGNPDLKPEYALNADAGFRLSPWALLWLEGTGFYADVTDLIGKQDTGNAFTYENIDSALITGVESALGLNLFKGMLAVDAAHTYMQTRDGRADRKLDRLDFRPEHIASLDGRLSWPFGTSLAVQYVYTAQRKYEVPGARAQVRTLPEFGITQARLAQTFRWNGGKTSCELYLEGKNLFDVYHETSPEKAAPGRTLAAGLAFDF